jgi:hypothetical protein
MNRYYINLFYLDNDFIYNNWQNNKKTSRIEGLQSGYQRFEQSNREYRYQYKKLWRMHKSTIEIDRKEIAWDETKTMEKLLVCSEIYMIVLSPWMYLDRGYDNNKHIWIDLLWSVIIVIIIMFVGSFLNCGIKRYRKYILIKTKDCMWYRCRYIVYDFFLYLFWKEIEC